MELGTDIGEIHQLGTIWSLFFRDPERVTPVREGIIVAPADGKVSKIINAVPPPELDLSYVDDPPPWCFVGGLYRVWVDGTWRAAGAQPPPSEQGFGWAWPGTVCTERRHHREEDAEPYLVCADCHHVGL